MGIPAGATPPPPEMMAANWLAQAANNDNVRVIITQNQNGQVEVQKLVQDPANKLGQSTIETLVLPRGMSAQMATLEAQSPRLQLAATDGLTNEQVAEMRSLFTGPGAEGANYMSTFFDIWMMIEKMSSKTKFLDAMKAAELDFLNTEMAGQAADFSVKAAQMRVKKAWMNMVAAIVQVAMAAGSTAMAVGSTAKGKLGTKQKVQQSEDTMMNNKVRSHMSSQTPGSENLKQMPDRPGPNATPAQNKKYETDMNNWRADTKTKLKDMPEPAKFTDKDANRLTELRDIEAGKKPPTQAQQGAPAGVSNAGADTPRQNRLSAKEKQELGELEARQHYTDSKQQHTLLQKGLPKQQAADAMMLQAMTEGLRQMGSGISQIIQNAGIILYEEREAKLSALADKVIPAYQQSVQNLARGFRDDKQSRAEQQESWRQVIQSFFKIATAISSNTYTSG